ncbi:MAG: LysM peptidoglycan-binding domain-containing protein, partial [Pseudomonadota bacterium]
MVLWPSVDVPAEDKGEETYAISLVQTAEIDKEIIEVDDRKVLAEEVTIQKGDHLWGLLRKRELLNKQKLPELLSVLKRLNPSLKNLDLVHPGEKIIIPLTIAPVRGMPSASAPKAPAVKVSAAEIKDLHLEKYTVRAGESLIRIIRDHFDIPTEDLHNEYLQLVKQMNPQIEDLNVIRPGQQIRLPIYSPQIVRKPIESKPPQKAEAAPEKQDLKPPEKPSTSLGRELGEILTLMGEEWVKTGQHFIPLKSGGQINLKAESFPIINLANGNRVIVDLHNDLPDKMAKLITSSWEGYRIVHLEKDDLRGALNKIFEAFAFPKVYRAGEPLELGGDIPLRLTADWIINRPPEASEGKDGIILVNLIDALTPETPKSIRTYLQGLGIKAIDYPSTNEPDDGSGGGTEILKAGDQNADIVSRVLELTGRQASPRVEIPIYQSEKTDFNLIVKADFLLNIGGRDSIIDLTGLGPQIVSLLNEHQFLVLTLSD